MAMELTPNYSGLDFNPTPNFSALNAVSPESAAPSWMKYMPYISGGFEGLSALTKLFLMLKQYQQMSQLRRFYKNWQEAGAQALSQNLGNIATRGGSGSTKLISDVIAGSYAPYQEAAGRGWASTIPQVSGPANPFDSFLKSLEAVRSAYPSKPSDTGVNFGYNASRSGISDLPGTGGGLDIGSFPTEDTELRGL